MIDKQSAAMYHLMDTYQREPMGDAQRDLLTTTEAAAYLGVTRQAVHLLTKQGIGTKYGTVWMFTRAELDAWRDKPRPYGGARPKAHAGALTLAHPA